MARELFQEAREESGDLSGDAIETGLGFGTVFGFHDDA
jgi:hypothetical protein